MFEHTLLHNYAGTCNVYRILRSHHVQSRCTRSSSQFLSCHNRNSHNCKNLSYIFHVSSLSQHEKIDNAHGFPFTSRYVVGSWYLLFFFFFLVCQHHLILVQIEHDHWMCFSPQLHITLTQNLTLPHTTDACSASSLDAPTCLCQHLSDQSHANLLTSVPFSRHCAPSCLSHCPWLQRLTNPRVVCGG